MSVLKASVLVVTVSIPMALLFATVLKDIMFPLMGQNV